MNGNPIPKSKKLPKIGKLQKEADRLMQIINKIQSPKCFLCGRDTQVAHHFFPKSVSANLRYNWDNLIPLCNGCHMRLHQSGDPGYEMDIRYKKGEGWYEQLSKLKRQSIKINREYYQTVLEKLQNRKDRFI